MVTAKTTIHYPSSDGQPMAESDKQFTPLTETVLSLRNRYLTDPDIYVAGNMLIYYEEGNPSVSIAPDVYICFGIPKGDRDTYKVWEEGKAPDLVIEIASGSTWRNDAVGKLAIYAGLGVTEYWRFDPTGELFHPPLAGNRLTGNRYENLPVNQDGEGRWRAYSALMGLELHPDGKRLRLFDPQTGEWLRNLDEEQAARLSAESQAQEERAARLTAESQAQEQRDARLSAESQAQEDRDARLAIESENRRLRQLLERMQSAEDRQ